MNATTDVSWGFQAVRSSYCVGGDCLRASVGPGRCVMVWNSQRPLEVQVWEPTDWADLLSETDEYLYQHPGVVVGEGQVVTLSQPGEQNPQLLFSRREWEAFGKGVRNGEFSYDKLSSPASRAGNSDVGRTAATGAVEPGVIPAPVVAGMNAAGYAAMNVPAGRDLRDESTPVGSLDAVATTGQPGPEPSVDEVDELAELIVDNSRMVIDGEVQVGPWPLARWLLNHGYRRAPAPAWGSGPLVKFDIPDTSHAAVDMGWASPDGLVNEAGEVGPAHPRLGPTEPADCEQARA